MTINDMSIEDASAMAHIDSVSMGGCAWTEKMFRDEFFDTTKYYLVAKINETVVGYCGFQHILDQADIMNIAILPEFRGQGIGKQLLNSILELADSLSVTGITLEVAENNAVAIGLYEYFGFTKEGIRKNYYNNNTNALIYWKYFNN
ncbi:MAG: ribosomal protein S18-alanine N-acetyltransferase [Bacillota bacterium]